MPCLRPAMLIHLVPFYSPKVFEQDDSLLTVTVQKFFAVVLNALEGLLAHIMLNAAGVHFGGLLIHAQVHEKTRKGLMAHENSFGDLPSLGGVNAILLPSSMCTSFCSASF